MKTLNLKLQGGLSLRPNIKIDGKDISYKRNKHDNIVLKHQTEKDSVDLTIENTLEIMGKGWWFVQMLFFIISCFGIFNPRLEKTCYCIKYSAKISLPNDENDVVLKFNMPKDKQKAITTDAAVEESENEYLLDEVAKKRKKILKWSFVLSWILLLVIVVLVVCVKAF